MTGPTAAPGWYPLAGDPATERYWNGTVWTEHHRTRPIPPTPPASGGSSNAGKILLGICLGIVLVIGGCIASTVLLVDSTIDTFEQLTVTTLQDDGRPGSITSPLVFGTEHSRPPSFSGSGWTLSVDEVRDLGDGCLGVVGTATLDTLSEDRELSFSRSFPEIELVEPNERAVEPQRCNRSEVDSDGRLWAQDIELPEGASFTWFETFDAEPDSYRYVSVSGTLYWS